MSAAPNLGVQPTGASQTPRIAERVYSVDERDYFTNFPFSPEHLSHTWPALFFTRWITHFCAPWFCFLAAPELI